MMSQGALSSPPHHLAVSALKAAHKSQKVTTEKHLALIIFAGCQHDALQAVHELLTKRFILTPGSSSTPARKKYCLFVFKKLAL